MSRNEEREQAEEQLEGMMDFWFELEELTNKHFGRKGGASAFDMIASKLHVCALELRDAARGDEQ